MDLQKLKNEDKLQLCKRYYIGGFALLPFMWIVNSIWFFNEAFRKPEYNEQKEIKTYVIRSMVLALISTAVVVAWVVAFQVNRVNWGATADYMSFVIPLGSP